MQLKIGARLIILGLFPFTLFLVFSSIQVFRKISLVNELDKTSAYLEVTRQSSSLIGSLYHESGTGIKFVYGRAYLKDLQSSIKESDKALKRFNLYLQVNIDDPRIHTIADKVSKELTDTRILYDDKEAAEQLLNSYLGIFQQLSEIYPLLLNIAPRQLTDVIQASYNLEKAKIAAASYRVVMFRILTMDSDLSDKLFVQLYNLKAKMDILVESAGQGLGNEAATEIKSLAALEDWQRVQEVF